ncbi:MAG: type II toxin-antitoxin system HicA family toxin [Verrucomicrobia bacterium]|nr:type II toxin-antitoxin system HicA family toxin [Verrucomicrobiota bacterium]
MPKLRRLSASDVVSIFRQFDFFILTQRGSHIKMRRLTQAGEKQTLTIPNHRQLDTGTCHAIFRQACRYIAPDDLRPHFYTD